MSFNFPKCLVVMRREYVGGEGSGFEEFYHPLNSLNFMFDF